MRTWAPRGARPLVKVRGAGGGRVSIAGVACYRPGDRPHFYYQLRICRRRKGEPRGFTWRDYRDLITSAHHDLSAPLVWVWGNLNVHLAPDLADFIAENKAWLRIHSGLGLIRRFAGASRDSRPWRRAGRRGGGCRGCGRYPGTNG